MRRTTPARVRRNGCCGASGPSRGGRASRGARAGTRPGCSRSSASTRKAGDPQTTGLPPSFPRGHEWAITTPPRGGGSLRRIEPGLNTARPELANLYSAFSGCCEDPTFEGTAPSVGPSKGRDMGRREASLDRGLPPFACGQGLMELPGPGVPRTRRRPPPAGRCQRAGAAPPSLGPGASRRGTSTGTRLVPPGETRGPAADSGLHVLRRRMA